MWALAEEKMTCDDQHKRTSETSQHQAMEMKVVRMEEQINALLRKWVVGWVAEEKDNKSSFFPPSFPREREVLPL